MTLPDLVYNVIMTPLTATGLYLLYRRPGLRAFWLPIPLVAAGVVVAYPVTSSPFAAARLIASLLFLHGIVWLIGSIFLLWKSHRNTAVVLGAGLLGLLGVAVDGFLIEPQWLDVTQTTIASPKIRRPLRIAVLADIQVDAVGEYERSVLAQVREAKPDLILFAGDYVHTPTRETRWKTAVALNDLLREAALAPRLGAFAVRGNVDGKECARCFAALPIRFVESTESFSLESERLELVCLEMRASFNPALAIPQRRADDVFRIVLGHSPNFALSELDADLRIAGHTHGGQVCLPFFGALTANASIPRAWASGLTSLPGGGQLYVSRGVGMERGHAPRLRFWCRPELAIIDLVPDDASDGTPAGDEVADAR